MSLRHARVESDRAFARVQGMKLRAELSQPRAAKGSFPYPARTCAEWRMTKFGVVVEVELSPAEQRAAARKGSAKLRDAIRRAGA